MVYALLALCEATHLWPVDFLGVSVTLPIWRTCRTNNHSVETPTLIEPPVEYVVLRIQVYFHTVYWCLVGCERGQPLFTLGLPLFVMSLEYFLSLPWGPSTSIDFFYLRQKCNWKDRQKFVGQILIKMETSFILFCTCPFDVLLGVTCKHAGGSSVEHAPHMQGSLWNGVLEARWSYLRYLVANFLTDSVIS